MTEHALSIAAAAAEAPAHPGLVVNGQPLSFAELAARTRPVTDALQALASRGVGHQPHALAVVAERSLDTALTLYAALSAQIPLALLHPRATAAENARLMALAAGLHARPDARDLLVMLATSGSRGAPKGVLLGRDAFVASARAGAARLGWRPGDRWLCCLPLAHIGGLSILTRCLIARSTAVLAGEGSFNPDAIAALIAQGNVTLVSLVPTMLAALLDAGWSPSARLRAVLVGGAAAPQALLDRAHAAGVPVRLTYGMSETCSQICTQEPGTGPAVAGRVGPPLPGVDIEIREQRIHVRAPMLFRGYLGADAQPGAPVTDERGFFATGDRGVLDAHGVLTVLGRADDTIITGGENVDPAEIEAVLAAHPGVAAACVFALPDPIWGELVAAAVVPRAGVAAPDQTADLLAEFLASRLASYKRPRRLAVLPALPLGPSGKIDRRAVAAVAAGRLQPLVYD